MGALTLAQKDQATALFFEVQRALGEAFERVDGQAKFETKAWNKEEGDGGGTMGVIRGPVVEKAGANVSRVAGAAYPAIESEYKDKPFFAAGVSTITHMMNPYAPIGHMNVRMIEVGDDFWIGGGADLTPFKPFEEDTQSFHAALKKACDQHLGPEAYARYKAWCDDYFFIPHRQSPRGVGGIFFDYLKLDFNQALDFLRATAMAYVETFPAILAKRRDYPYTAEEKDAQLYWRGRYAEFNLVHDRGTKFGLMTGGNIEAIFVSLPPVVKW